MATIKDIAKMAGVAQGTVSNVLNGKGNVSSEKVKHVLAVAAALGYTPNERAKYLRKGHTNMIALILPTLGFKQYLGFYTSFKNYAEGHNYLVQLYLTNDRKETEAAILSEVKSSMAAGIAAFTCCATHNIYEDLVPGFRKNTIFVERSPEYDANFIGFDYQEAGRKMGEKAVERGYQNICLVTADLAYSNEQDFYNSFMESATHGGCVINHIQTDHYRKSQNILHMVNNFSPQAIFLSNYGFAESVKDICQNFYSNYEPEIYTVSPNFILPENDFIKYELNYRHLGNMAAEALIKQVEKEETTDSMILEGAGFRDWSFQIKGSKSQSSLNVLTLDSPSAYTMMNLSKLYSKKSGVDINITVYSYDEIYETFMNMGDSSVFDIIRLDMTWLSWFAERILRPLDGIDPDIRSVFPEFLDGVAERYSMVNDRIYALPSSPSVQLLYYRKDLFADTVLRRIYQETYKTELALPETFTEFNRIARFFTKAFNPSSAVDYGTTITLGSTGVAGSEFLARYFSYSKNLYDENHRICLNNEAAVKSLEQMVEIKQYTSKNYQNWWRDTAHTFADGNMAMAILYSNFASDLLKHSSKVADHIGYTYVPGRNPVIGGGCLGISKYSRNPQEALSFIRWTCSEPVSSASTFLGSVSPCKKTYDNYEVVDTYPWLNLAKDCFAQAHGRRTPPEVKIPFNERRFVNLIGMAVKNAYSGAVRPKEALDFAQEQFKKQFGELYWN